MAKTLSKAIEGEKLNLTVGSRPVMNAADDCKEPVKELILSMLKEKYDIEEEDFLSAELEIVPAGPARDYGLDRSMIMGYGHDDRVLRLPVLQGNVRAWKRKTYRCLPAC